MTEARWTTAMVETRLIEAADILKRLPGQRVQGFYSLWPAIAPSFDDLVGQTARPMSPARPAPDAIDRMEQTLDWFKWLEPEDVKLVWARAENAPWKMICWRFGISRPTAHRRWQYAVSLITWRLNGRRVPGKRSRRSLIEGANRP
jgi:hypothetical protein